ncbi:MAG: TonB family protein [bacterium]
MSIGHGLVIGMLLAIPFIHGCEDDSSTDMSKVLELYVEPPPSDSHESPADLMKNLPKPPEDKQEEKVEDKKDTPPPDKDEVTLDDQKKVKPKVKPKDKKKEVKPGGIKVSNKIVKRDLPNGKGKLTPDEVRKLLGRGAKLGKKSSLSDADLRRLLNSDSQFGDGSPISQEFVVLDMVRQAMYRAWDQPTDIGIAGLVTKVELTFTSSGSITASRMLASSGNKTMDASVMRAVQSVHRINGLPASFLSSHRRIPVSFELTGNQ